MKKYSRLNIPFVRQKNIYYCGPAVLQMVFSYFGKKLTQAEIAKKAKTNKNEGTLNSMMVKTVSDLGFYGLRKQYATFGDIAHYLKKRYPVIVNYIEPMGETHFAIVSNLTKQNIILTDPWHGKNLKLSRPEFFRRWHDQSRRYVKWILVVSNNPFV